MNKIRRYSSVAFTAVFALAVFFSFLSHCGHTSGCASAQPSAGAAVCALLLTIVQLLCYLTFRNRNLLLYSLSFIPAVFLWVFCCKESPMTGSLVAVIISLAALYATFRFRLRPVFRILAIPVIYMLCGPAAFIYALAICADEFRPAELLCSLLVLVACILAGRFIFHWTLLQPGAVVYCAGSTVAWIPFVASILAAALCWLASLDWSGVRPSTSTWLGWGVAMVIAAAIPFCVPCLC